MKNIAFALLVALFGLLGLLPSAYAALTLPASLSVTDMESVASLIIVAAAAIWVMRKVISFFGR